KEYVAKYTLSFINIELEGLPEREWEKTLSTWVKIFAFAKNLLKLPEEKRKEVYRKYRFDTVMEGVMEDVVKVLYGFYSLGILKPEEKPQKVLERAIELVEGEEELLKREGIKKENLEFIKDFLKKIS
ncbi:MAG: hypothetical protein DSY32_00865, partial [Aquifex sp.]